MAFALDIEAINTVTPREFDNPAGWDPFAIGVAHLPEEGADSPETDVIFRAGDTTDDLQALLEDSITWLHDRATPDEPLYTYNGSRFDLPVLKECALELSAKPPYTATAKDHLGPDQRHSRGRRTRRPRNDRGPRRRP